MEMVINRIHPFTVPEEKPVLFRELFLNYLGYVTGNNMLLKDYEQLLEQCEKLKGDIIKEDQLSGYTHTRFTSFSQAQADKFTALLMKHYGLRTDIQCNPHFYLQYLSRFPNKTISFLVKRINAVPGKIASKRYKLSDDEKAFLIDFGFCKSNQISFLVDGVHYKNKLILFTAFCKDSIKN